MILVASINSTINIAKKNSELGSLFFYKWCAVVKANIVYLVLVMLTACQANNEPKVTTFNGPIMGTEYSVTIVTTKENLLSQIDNQIDNQILQQLEMVNQSMSTYIESSEVSKINRLEAGVVFEVSQPLLEVLKEAQEVSILSKGAFDITMANAVDLWGFGPDGDITKQPRVNQIESLRRSAGFNNIQLEDNNLIKLHTETAIDLSAIAKGFAVDQIAKLLDQQGVNNYLINIGGELRAKGKNKQQQVWRIAIEKPQISGGVQQIIQLQDQAIATSGDYRNYLTFDGRRYSHTIDPTTLKPVLNRLTLVSVISNKASTADGLATAMMAMGETKAIKFADKLGLAAYFIIREENDTMHKVIFTDKFASILQ